MSVESSRGLQGIQSSFNNTIIERYLQHGAAAKASASPERAPAAPAGSSPQTPERSGSAASLVESPSSPALSEASYFDEWDWAWEEQQGEEAAAPSFVVSLGRYVFVPQALQFLVRLVVTFLVYLYAVTLWALSCVNVSVKFVTHIHRPAAAAGPPGTPGTPASRRARRREGPGALDFGGVTRSIQKQQQQQKRQRLGVLEDVTDRLELLFTGMSAWIDGGGGAPADRDGDGGGDGDGNAAPAPARAAAAASARRSSDYDARTVADMIHEAGYPCEEHQVLTPDGYFLQMFRIPRARSRKGSVLFVHGVYDSAMAFVSGGLCSQPFAAYDNGFDVWLGNLRICSPWRKLGNDSNFAANYWNFSINELAIHDCGSFVAHIRTTRRAERGGGEPERGGGEPERSGGEPERGGGPAAEPERLQVVAHSLGGSVALLYLIWSRRMARPAGHGVSRLILLSPAGFHHHHPPVAVFLFVVIDLLFGFFLRRMNFGLYLPTRIGRLLLHKLMQDVVNIPALMALVNLVVGKFSLSDSSDFAAALHMPHLNPDAMVGASYKLCLSLYRCYTEKRFVSFHNFNNRRKNVEQFGCPGAIDVAAEYALIDIPVDLTAGTRDGVIHADNIRCCHYEEMRRAGVEASYEEFDSGHLEFRANESRALRKYVLERLEQV